MKSTVEKLSPTRVRINVEVPFTELRARLRPCLQGAGQADPAARLPARQGAAQAARGPHRPRRRARAGRQRRAAGPLQRGGDDCGRAPLGQPEIEITKSRTARSSIFTAEVDIRPEIELPDLEALKITVDPIEVTDEEVDAELQSLRARFGTLTGVERAAENGDFVSIDLSATVDGEDVPEATTEGLSHEVGSGQLIEGLDEAIIGLKEGESRVFTTTLAAGDHAGQEAQVTVTVKSVKERELPEPDDEFAQLASEFDTDRRAAEQPHRAGAAGSSASSRPSRSATRRSRCCSSRSRSRCPRRSCRPRSTTPCTTPSTASTTTRRSSPRRSKEQGSSREEFDADNRTNAEKAVKTQLLMDAIADKLDIQVGQNDLTERLVLMSRQYGLEPQQLLQYLQENNQLPAMFADVRRGLTVAAVVHGATVTDTDGNVIDTTEFFGPSGEQAAASRQADAEPTSDADETDPTRIRRRQVTL